jgi:hypothetical protein
LSGTGFRDSSNYRETCQLVSDRPQGRATYYRIARPELFGLLSAAEQLLAATGTAIELCPNYQGHYGQTRP